MPTDSTNSASGLNSPNVTSTPWSNCCFWLLTFLTACFCAYVLWLPVFPTEDGPIHLYFATILGDLLRHNSPLYAQYYVIQHLLPPYSLQYYMLIALMKLVSAPAAEKIFVCVIIANFSFGFRYLATSIGRAGELISLLIVALLFNWPLGMGFENFSLSLGAACWALGLWTRLQNPTSGHCPRALRSRFIFVILLFVMTLTHAIPVTLTLGFAALDLALRWLSALCWKSQTARLPGVVDVITWLAGASTLGYIYFFTNKQRSSQEMHAHIVPLAELIHYAKLFGLAFFGGTSMGSRLYHWALYLIFYIGLSLGARTAWKQLRLKNWSAQLSWFVAASMMIALQPFLPVDINGSHWFAERLLIFSWIALLAAASGAEAPGRLGHWSIFAFSIAITAGVLALAQAYLAPVARRISALEKAPVQSKGQIGLVLPGHFDSYTFDENLRYYPFEWAPTYYFRRSESVLLNTPWMDLPILPLGGSRLLLTYTFPPTQLEDLRLMRDELLTSADARALVFPRLDFIFFSDPNHTASKADIDEVLKVDPGDQWSCARPDWYVFCQKQTKSLPISTVPSPALTSSRR